MDKLTESDLTRIANLCLVHSDKLTDAGSIEVADDYLEYYLVLIQEKFRRFGR